MGDVVTFAPDLEPGRPGHGHRHRRQDLLPAGLEFVSASPGQGTYDPASGLWTVGALPSSASTTLFINARVITAAAFTNGASIVAADQFDPDTGDNSASASGTPQLVDIAVNRVVDNPRPNVGDVVTFTVNVSNLGPDLATNVQVSSPVFANNFTTVSFETSQGTYDPQTGAWSVGSLATGGSQVLTIRARVISPASSTVRSSLARVDQFDTGNANNVSTIAINPQESDLALSTTVDDTTPNVGQFVTYTVTLTNIGPDSATGVRVNDTLPSNVQFVSATPSRGGFDPTTGLWTIGTVEAGNPLTLQIVGRVVAPGASTTTVSIQTSDQFDPVTANNTAITASDPQQADLALASAVDVARPNVGDVVTLTVTLTNSGPAPASGVSVRDLLPAGLQYDSSTTSQGIYDPASGLWTVGSVVAGSPQTLQIRALVTAAAAATTTASIDAADQFDPNPGNNSASTATTPQRSDLAVTQVVDQGRPNVGDVVTFTITVTSAGPDPATGVVINDLLPPGLTFVGASDPGTYDPSTGLWPIGTVVPGTPVILQVQGRVVSLQATSITATASADQFDPIPLSNTSTVSLNPRQADLSVNMTLDNPAPNVGDTVAYTIRVFNSGPDDATGVRILDLLPAGLGLDSASPSQGLYSQATGLWEVGQVGAGSFATLVLVLKATVLGPASVTNTATIVAADQSDPSSANNSVSLLLTPQQADLTLTRSVDNPTPNVGDVVTFFTTIINNGPDTATGIRVNDALPAGFSFVSSSTGTGTYDASTGIWIVGQVNASGTATLAIQGRVTSANPTTSTASIAGVAQFDPNTADNSASVAVIPRQADLALTSAVDLARPNVGDVVTFTLNLTNNGPDTATGVRVLESLPSGYTLISAVAGSGTYDPSTGFWSVASLGSAGSTTLTLQARLDSVAPVQVTATVVGADQSDPDTGDNQTSVDVNPQRVDLSVAMSVSDPTPNLNDTLTYSVVLTNNGPDPATNVSLIDFLPPGVSFISSNPGQGTFNPLSGVWAVGSLPANQSVSLVLNVQVTDPDAIINRIQVQNVDQFDTNPSNDSSETSTVPQQAELTLSLQVDNPRPEVNGIVNLTLTVRNLGPDDTTNVVIQEPLPPGLRFVSSATSLGSYDEATGLWTISLLPGQQDAILTITAIVDSPATATAVASIQAVDQFDPNLNNNVSSVQVQPLQNDLSLTNSVDQTTPNVGDLVHFTITLNNQGPDDASGLQVRDLLPPGLSFVSSQALQGSYDPSSGIWQVGAVASGTSTTLMITARVVSPDPIAATSALVASDHFDPDPVDNAASVQLAAQNAELALAMTVDKPRPNVGDVVTFTVTLSNSGPDAATHVSIIELLPPGFSLESAQPSRGTYDATTGLWNMDVAGAGTVGVLVLRARVTSPVPATNTATIVGVDQFDPDPENNSVSINVAPSQSDLALTYAVDNTRPNVGGTVNLTVTVTNNGPDDSTAVVLLDPLIPGLPILSSDPGQGTFNPNNGLWVIGSIPAGQSRTLTLGARVDSSQPLTSTVQISSSDQFDPDPLNNSATITINPLNADLIVTNTVDNPGPDVGDLVTFTIQVANAGPDAATGVRLINLLPAGFTFVSASPSRGTYRENTGVWDLGSVDLGSPQQLTLVALVTSFVPGADQVRVDAADQFDPTTTNNSAQAAVSPMYADLSLTLSADVVRPTVNQVVAFTLTLNSNGPDATTGVRVAIPLPPGFELVSVAPSQGSFDPVTGLWTPGLVSPNVPLTLQVRARVVGGGDSLVSATIGASDRFDATTSDWTAGVAILPQRSDLGLSYAVDNPRPNVGDLVTLILSLSNAGLDDASNIRVSSPIPEGFQLVSNVPGSGTYDPATGTWSVPTLGAGGTTTLILQARLATGVPSLAAATVLGADQFDTNTSNNSATVSLSPLRADLSVAVEAPGAAVVGQVIPIRITLANLGPDAASGVIVRVPLPAGLRPTALLAGQGVYDPGTGLWTVGGIPAGGTTELVIQAEVVSPGNLPLTALITQSGRFDPSSGNNTAARVVVAQPAPPAATGRLGGVAFSDRNGDGVRNTGEPVLAGVTITLTGVDALGRGVQRQTTTSPDGSFQFDGLLPGTYELAQAGTGNGRIAGIVLPEGGTILGLEVAIAPLAGSRLAGTVYYDLNHNGVFDGPDFGIANTSVILSGQTAQGIPVRLQIVTGADGSYAFEGLQPGLYSLTEIQPRLFHDYHENVGTLGGVGRNNRFDRIALGPRDSGEDYNFGELQGRESHLRHFAIYLGNAEARLRARRALNPSRFDANHPQYATALAQGQVPFGQGFIPRAAKIRHYLPTIGTRRVNLTPLQKSAVRQRAVRGKVN